MKKYFLLLLLLGFLMPLFTLSARAETAPESPAITSQPESVDVEEGQTAVFKVAASSSVLYYQWYYKKPDDKKWSEVSSKGTSATYKLTAAARHDGYRYRCKVYNDSGYVYSATVTLTIMKNPAITTQPADKTVYEGKPATFKTEATGGGLKYQWYYQKPGETTWTKVQKNGTAAAYTVNAELRHDGYKYRVKISNTLGSVTSQTVKLTVKAVSKPAITTQPEDRAEFIDAEVTFTVKASGGGLYYQWYYKAPDETSWKKVDYKGTSATLRIDGETAGIYDNCQFRCKVTNNAGTVTSKAATLTIITPPFITGFVSGVFVSAGHECSFSVNALGNALTYQWYYLKPGETTWRPVKIGGTSSTYTFTAEMRHNGYQYHCVVSNPLGEQTSGDALLTVYYYSWATEQ